MGASRRVCCTRWAIGLSILAACLRGFAQVTVAGGSLLPSDHCALGFVASPDLVQRQPAAIPQAGGATHTAAEELVWRDRALGKDDGESSDELKRLERADWARIQGNAKRFAEHGEPAITALDDDKPRAVHGTLVRDAAFAYLLTKDEALLTAVRANLLAQTKNPFNDFTGLCVRPLNGVVLDAWFFEAGWLLRHAVAYDYVRKAMPAEERLVVENWLRRSAYALAGQLDWGLAQVFPNRAQDDYSKRLGAAAAQGDARWTARRFDSNNDCLIDDKDDPRVFQVVAYGKANGDAGPRLSLISQYYNNRRSASAAAIGVIGVMLGDVPLVNRARRYFTEWLTFSVLPDGSQGEFARNGNYCIPGQGLIYGATNSQAMVLVAWALARQGDRSLFDYSTRDGLFGSECAAGDSTKSLSLVASTLLKLRTGDLSWFYFEPWREQQQPRPETRLGETRSRYKGEGNEVENFHELGTWLAEPYLNLPALRTSLVDRVRRNAVAASTGKVVTGLGTLTDTLNALPAVVLIRP